MNKKAITTGVLSVVMFTMSAVVTMAYNEPGPASAPVCGNVKPQKAWLYRVKSLGKGQYQLYWDKADKASSWTVGYGTQPGKYIYGQNNFGDSNSRGLTVNTFSNKTFYFAVKANNGCMPGDWSNEWKVGTGSIVSTVATTGTVKKTTTPVVKKTTGTVKTVTPTVTKAPAKVTTPVVTQSPTVKTPTTTTTPTTPAKSGGFWGWLKGLFQ